MSNLLIVNPFLLGSRVLGRRLGPRYVWEPPYEVPWYVDGANFKCTGCGKCCMVQGDVWLNPHDFVQAADYLGISLDEFTDRFTMERKGQWVRLKSIEREGGAEACIFLDQQNKCTIYEARPVQCRTYPFWPRIIKSKDKWEEEAVLPDDMPGVKHWNPEDGGCEGIEHKDSEVVPFEYIRRQLQLQVSYYSDFPFQ